MFKGEEQVEDLQFGEGDGGWATKIERRGGGGGLMVRPLTKALFCGFPYRMEDGFGGPHPSSLPRVNFLNLGSRLHFSQMSLTKVAINS